jgi:RNA polymerase sigma-70 factor, ECF subfamily
VNSICNNVLMELYRISSRVEALEDETAERLVETRPNALSMVISDDTRDLVRRVLEDLKERDRSLLQAVFLEERDKDVVCEELGVDRDYLRVLLHRAKSSFRLGYSKRIDAKKYH